MRSRLSAHPTVRVLAVLGAGVLVGAVGLGAPASASAATVADQWTGTFGNGANTGTNAGETAITTATASKVAAAWTDIDANTGDYPSMVVGGVTYSVGGAVDQSFIASSPTSGAVQWSIPMPGSSINYGFGMAATGSTVLVSFRANEPGAPGEVIAVSTTKRAILWRASLPAATIAWDDDSYPGKPYTDGSRVYVAGASDFVNAYSLSTGALLYRLPVTVTSTGAVYGGDVAVGGGYIYESDGPGLIVYAAATGKKVWTSTSADVRGVPVLAGGRVFVQTLTGVAAYPASGCGASSCPATWSTTIPAYGVQDLDLSAADSSNVYVTSEITGSSATACSSRTIGTITRLAASTGAVQWTAKVGEGVAGLVHGGDVLWAYNEYLQPQANGGCTVANRIVAFSASGTSTKSLETIALPADEQGFPQSLSVASGTLFRAYGGSLYGYRVK